MSNKTKLITSVETKNDSQVLEIEISYSLGGMNYFSYKNEGRGFYLSVKPLKRGNGFVSFTAFSGIKSLVKEVARFSAKVLESITVDESLVFEMVDHVVSKNQLELEDGAREKLAIALREFNTR